MIVLYVVLGIIGLFFLLQFFMIFKMRLQKGKTAPVVNGPAGKAIGRGEKVLLYFFSPGCGACRPMTPVIQKMSKSQKNVFPIDISRDMTIARKFGVMGTPSTVLVETGKIKEFLVGPQAEEKLRGLLA
jgi:thioredoxin 1